MRRILGLLLVLGFTLACSVPGFEAATATVPTVIVIPNTGEETELTPPVIVVPNTGGEETATAIPTGVATAAGSVAQPSIPIIVTATLVPPTPSVPMVTPNAVNVNCRSGPDMAYDSVSILAYGVLAQVAGRTADSSWWYVQDPNNAANHCWVAASVVSLLGPTGGIPLAALPAPIADKVTVAVAAPPTVVCGLPNPVALSGTISTNGATTVQFQWEITGNQTVTTAPQGLVFTAAGTTNVAGPASVNIDCGSYTVALHVLSPNDLSASKAFTVERP
jgi:hypothetical protein